MKVRSIIFACVFLAAACDSGNKVSGSSSTSITLNPCTPAGTLTLAVATTALVDCSGGGTTLTLAGNGASYMIVPQFPTDQAAPTLVSYQLFSGTTGRAEPSAAIMHNRGISQLLRPSLSRLTGNGTLPRMRNMTAQRNAENVLRARSKARGRANVVSASRVPTLSAQVSRAQVPAAGSVRSFKVASSFTSNTFATVGATLAYVGTSVLIYIDTLAPANGFTPAQLNAFGVQFDQTLYPIDTAAFGGPSDIDGNGHVIMLMTPVVNADTPTSQCANEGFVAGFFDSEDFNSNTGVGADLNSNAGEVFYSIVPDSSGKFSCEHGVGEVGYDVPGTFLHELQHLINYSQHVVVSGGSPSSSWLDEGMSIVAEELGSVYYEQKCPPPACRTSPSQLFPDSSQGFVQGFLTDSYNYALVPDTATILLSTDDEDGFSWRGGAWLFARYLGDQFGSTIYKQIEKGPANALTDVAQVTGQPFTSLFANFGVALYTDSLPGLPRTTAPPVNRFVSRNVKALWGRLFTTGGSGAGFPYPDPLYLYPLDSTAANTYSLIPGSMTFYGINTPANASTVTIRFAAPGGLAFPAALHAQIAVFRLPPGVFPSATP